MKKILLAYYSYTGTTRILAEYIASLCSCDIEEIKDLHGRQGILGVLRSGWQGWLRHPAPIKEVSYRVLDYDLVVVGTPVWVGNPAAPVRRYLLDNRTRFNRVAFFCTLGGSGDDKALEEMGHIVDRTPIATLSVTQGQVASNRYRDKAQEFAEVIGQSVGSAILAAAICPSSDKSNGRMPTFGDTFDLRLP